MKNNCIYKNEAILDYSLEIHVPNCGQADVNWKKICGNPIRKYKSFILLKKLFIVK
jgi:hypothetical protein